MAVHWFPGHMHKALKEIKEKINQVDVIIEVLDARIPYSSENPEIAKIRGDKPCLKVFNKSDLADPEKTEIWQAHFESAKNVKTLQTRLDDPALAKQILPIIREMFADKEQSVRNINAMIMGIPNVGKSTLINILAERTIAKTGNEPAVTKAQQRINLGSGIVLFDTPGVLWPKLINPNTGYRLASSGAVKDTAMEYDDVGFFAADYLIKAYPDALKQRFDMSDIPSTEIEFLEAAAAKRGALMAGGRVNLHKICELLINDLRTGKLGGITLEMPEMVVEELALVEEEEQQKADKKAARKAKFKDGSLTPDKRDRKEIRVEKRESKRGKRRSR